MAMPGFDGEWLHLLRGALARGERFRWRLQGTSMSPTLPPGCLIEIAALPSQPKPGNVVVFSSGGQLVAHRFVQRSGKQWVMQGDGRLGPDRPLDASQGLGIVVAAFSADGRPFWPPRFPRVEASWWIARYHVLHKVRSVRLRLRRIAEQPPP
jgi:hypothetical protein